MKGQQILVGRGSVFSLPSVGWLSAPCVRALERQATAGSNDALVMLLS